MCLTPEQLNQLFNRHAHSITDLEIDSLAKASQAGNTQAVKQILDQHPEAINMWDIWVYVRQTPLMHAAAGGHLDTMKLLIDRGADVNAINDNGWTPLSVVARWGTAEAAKLLIESGADVNPSLNGVKWSPLMEAAWSQQVDTVKVLIAGGADVNAKDWQGKTVLIHAEELKDQLSKDKFMQDDVKANAVKSLCEIIDALKKGPPPKLAVVPKGPKI
jgi:ankyrin repeat protein